MAGAHLGLPGDEIVAINGARGLPLWRVAEIFRKADVAVVLIVKRKNSVLEVKVHLRSPFPPSA
jgi:hypothetical protein